MGCLLTFGLYALVLLVVIGVITIAVNFLFGFVGVCVWLLIAFVVGMIFSKHLNDKWRMKK